MIPQVNEITEDILQNYEKKLLDKIINTHYFYFLNYEKAKIIDKALRRLEMEEDDAASLRVDIIREKLEEYLSLERPATDNILASKGAVEGFVRFRLREYYSVLETVVDDAAQEFLIEREYEEFIGLLKYFVEISESKLPILHIVPADCGYTFLDHNKRDITNECLSDFLLPIEGVCGPFVIAEDNINYDDMLISTLIMLAPARILWHAAEESTEIATTVKKIFEDRLELC